MCFTRRDQDERRIEARQKDQQPREERPEEVWDRTSPRGNQEPDRHDVERGAERLEALVGH